MVEPASGDRTLTIDTKKRTITSDGDFFAITHPDLPELQVYVGPINWDLGGTGSDPKSILDYDITGVKKLKGIPVQRLQAALTKSGKTNLRPTLRLSFWPFDYFGAITSTTQFTIDNDNGADFSGLEIKADRVAVLGLELKDVSVKWQQGGTWAGGATVVLRFANAYEVGAGFGLRDGGFDFARGSVGALNVAVSPGIFLQRIGFEVRRNPFSLAGTVGFSGGPSVAGKQAVTVDGTFKAVLDDPWVLEVSGKAKVAERFELGEAFLRYTSGGLFELGGKAQWNLSVAYVNGSVSGFVDGRVNAFDLEGSVRGCISVKYLPDPCAGAKFLVSNIGIAACIDLTIVSGGVGYYWGGDFDLFGGSMRPEPVASHAQPGRGRRGRAGAQLHAAGRVAQRRLRRGGRGRRSGHHADRSARREDLGLGRRAVRSHRQPGRDALREREHLRRGEATGGGNVDDHRRRRRADPRVREAVGLPDPSVSARVTGRGRSRTLHWRLRPIAGQRVRFVEVGKDVRNVIATTSAARGQARFRPADGPAAGGGSWRSWSRTGCSRKGHRRRVLRRPGPAAPDPAPQAARRAPRLSPGGELAGAEGRLPPRRHLKLGGRAPAPAHRRSASPVGHSERSSAALRRDRDGGGADERQRPRSVGASLDQGPPARPTGSGEVEDDHRVRLHREGQLQRRARRPVRGRLARHPGRGAGATCGTSELRVSGRLRVSSGSRAGAPIWIVGRSAPRALDGVATRGVTVTRAGKRLRGTLKLAFEGRRKVSGALAVSGCRVFFSANCSRRQPGRQALGLVSSGRCGRIARTAARTSLTGGRSLASSERWV